MKFKHALLTLVASATVTLSPAQDYYHAFGFQANLGLYTLTYTSPTLNYSGTTGTSVPGVFYKATLGFGDAFAVSAYPFVGLNLSVNSQTGTSGGIGFALPVNAELHFGDLDDNCFFLGAGFNMGFFGNIGYGSGSIIGPEGAIGGQFTLRERVIGLRVAYTQGVNKTNLDVPNALIFTDKKFLVTFGIFYPIGI